MLAGLARDYVKEGHRLRPLEVVQEYEKTIIDELDLMREAAVLARDKGVMLHTHLAETLDEERFCREHFGCTPVEYMERVGWVGPDVWYAHAVHLDDAGIETMARTGTAAAHCPTSNARLGAGIARAAGIASAARGADGHAAGAAKVVEFLGWCQDIGVNVATLYLLSTDNLTKRESKELQELMDVIGSLATELAASKNFKLQLVGDREALPADLLKKLEDAEKASKKSTGLHVNLAVGYGGRKEIADAMRSILKKHAKKGTSVESLAELLTPELITQHLYTGGQPDPDLVIRTSGEQRLSGFLLWQSANSEFYFEEALWPDFRRVDFLRAIRAFERRHRRFGA